MRLRPLKVCSSALLCSGAVVALSVACANDGAGEGGEPQRDERPTTMAPATTCVRRTEVVVFVNPAVDGPAIDVIEAGLRDVPGVAETMFDADRESPSFRLSLDDPSHIEGVRVAAESLDGVGQVIVPEAGEASAVAC